MSENETVREVSTLEGYASWAASYDQENNALIAVEEIHVDPLLAQISFENVLDVGAGTGRYALKLARTGAKVTAFDQSAEMLAIAQQTAQSEDLSINFQLAPIDNGLPFRGDQFDLLICALMLCHVSDMTAAVREFVRVLQPDGHLLITDFHPDSVYSGWRTHFKRAGVKYLLPNMPYTRDDYIQALTTNGLNILHIIELSLKEVPEEYLSKELLYGHEDQLLCLVILAQK